VKALEYDGNLVNIPPLLRAIESRHRAALTHAFGQLQPEPGWAPPDLDVLFLCFTNRCGSNYLAHLLASTGAFNEAGEFFNAPVVLMHAVPRGVRSLPEYFSALPALVPHSGRIAAKASIDQLVMLADAGILDALRGRATYLLMERQDRLAQAISRAIAWQNGRWTTAHASDVPDSALVFDRAAIDLELAMVAYDNAAFSLFFSANGIVPIHITYEALLADAGHAVEAVAATMGLADLSPRLDKVTIYRQANAINAAWRATYLANSSFAGMIPNADKLALRDDPAAYVQVALKDLLKVAATAAK
jgi:LPS sulfotransferase NodH